MRDHVEELLVQLTSDDPMIHKPAAQKLAESGAAAAVPLSRVCNTGSAFSHRAASLLQKIGRDAVKPLIEVVQTGDQDAQGLAIVALSLIRDPSSLTSLIEALKSPFAEVRKEAISALWMLRDAKAVEALIQVLQHDNEIEVAAQAAWALGLLKDRRSVPPLLWAMENRNWQLRRSAASALGYIGDDETLQAIRSHLFDAKPQVRKAVKNALSKFHSRKFGEA